MFLCHLVNTVNISSVALLPWIRNVFGLHIDETSVGPQIVISTFFCEVSISVMYNLVVFAMRAMY